MGLEKATYNVIGHENIEVEVSLSSEEGFGRWNRFNVRVKGHKYVDNRGNVEDVVFDGLIPSLHLSNVLNDLIHKDFSDWDKDYNRLRAGVVSAINFLKLAPYTEKVTEILNSTLDTEELGVYEEFEQYYLSENTVYRNLIWKCDKTEEVISTTEDWELIRIYSQFFVREWVEYSTHLPFNDALFSNWKYDEEQKNGDD